MLNEPWRITLFGDLRAEQGTEKVTRFRTHAAGELLAYLALYPDGAVPPIAVAEEPSFPGSLGFGFDTFKSAGDIGNENIRPAFSNSLSVHYDGRVLEALYAEFGTPAAAVTDRSCPVEALREGMILTRNVLTRGGRTVLLAGLRLGAAHLLLLRDLVEILDIKEPVHVSHD